MARAPEPGDGCRPGGSCPECNPPPVYCQTCLEVEVEDVSEPCAECARNAAEDAALTKDEQDAASENAVAA
jgi:hypothetical protein